ncbi:hypothetical protein G7084_01415 [Weissella coleopterorum]|uniref:Uncharacterized protein n=1 Tax=Weissella coleopterorum TaxID=2714949 RepID=A0A6G8AYQ4_9LACO|nr:DUF6731 family protein [Weissella coleopterorum]QIL50095.1 hypothetical protein G7084_01415 [Weissella coleopterorum]
MTVKKVKFSFYNISLSQNGARTKLKWEDFLEYFPTENSDDTGKKFGNQDGKYRNLDFGNGIIRLDHMSDRDGFLYMNFVKLSENGASKAKAIKSGIKDLDLDEDEYVAFDVSAIVDKASGIMMLQNNKFAMTAKRFVEYINLFWSYNKYNKGRSAICVDEIPADEVNLKKGKNFKKFHFAVEDFNDAESRNLPSSLLSGLRTINRYNGYKVDITISKERSGNKFLLEDAIREDIENVRGFSKAEVVYLDDYTEKTETLDLLDENKTLFLEFDIRPKEMLDPVEIEGAMRARMEIEKSHKFK